MSQYSLQRHFVSTLCLTLVVLVVAQNQVIASAISEGWVQSTLRIENEWGSGGTGFLLFRSVDKKIGKIFLVTNKHVLNENSQKRQLAKRLRLFVNVKGADGGISGESFELPLIEENERIWREHPNPNVDVLAIDVTRAMNRKPQMQKSPATYSDFVTPEIRKKDDINIADEVLIIGYPDPLRTGLANARTNYPIVRQGIIATRIGEPVTMQVEESPGKVKTVEIPGFLVDSTVIPGSSGSPVVLKPARGLRVAGDVGEATLIPEKKPYLLGIVSATNITAIKIRDSAGNDRYFPALAGLGVVYDVETIKETVELFFSK